MDKPAALIFAVGLMGKAGHCVTLDIYLTVDNNNKNRIYPVYQVTPKFRSSFQLINWIKSGAN